jgi:hypothetical protein
MELSEGCLFSNPQPTRHRRRYAVQPSAQLHCANLLLLCHGLNQTLSMTSKTIQHPECTGLLLNAPICSASTLCAPCVR